MQASCKLKYNLETPLSGYKNDLNTFLFIDNARIITDEELKLYYPVSEYTSNEPYQARCFPNKQYGRDCEIAERHT